VETILKDRMEQDFRTPLGEILIRNGLLSRNQLMHALQLQQASGSRLGDILIAEGMLGYFELYRAVAESCDLPFVNLLEEPPSPELTDARDADMYLLLRLIPWRRNGEHICIAVSEVTFDAMAWIRQRFGVNTTLVITSPFDIRRTVERLFARNMEEESRLALWQKLPQQSARTTMIPRQKQLTAALLITVATLIFIAPVLSALWLLMLCQFAYCATMIFKYWVFSAGEKQGSTHDHHYLATMNPHALPIYTVLIPMYKEAASLPGMLNAMQELDYPAAKLDIKLVLEADDHETLEAAYALKPCYQFDIIRVPPGNPRTKPKACNYALRFSRGEFVTIFDADDRPEPAQLKKAVHAFRTLPEDIICLQARLNYYNADDNWLTRFFALEYSILFEVMLHGLERLGIPIPLGGTSNHIALARLKSLGEWDPYNVTEDADLGTRLAARGFHTAMLDSHTMEEAPNRVWPWLKQRSRWIKGYMQTWLVHMREPVRLYRALGWKSFAGFQCFIGLSTFTFLSAPVVWLLSLLWVGQLAHMHSIVFPAWLGWFTIVNLCLNIFSHWYFTFYCVKQYHRHQPSMRSAALLYPLYLVLHSVASYKALWQLIVNPHFWEKTTHGLARHTWRGNTDKDLILLDTKAI